MFDFGQRLLRLRKEHGLSQKELAQRIQVSKSTLANYENDMGFPSLPVAEDMADAFNVSLDYLACGEKAKIITARNLKDDQIQLITELVQEMASPDANGFRLSARQQDLLARLIEQFLR
ncbi:helix-turn-helix domain-containing protein [uncultured Subdoligranulum sp.]|uniref:helix-turn-helix domain-containing protein n=1 Tax=uncultured Subdoligranulum sp. TaxID=512298 RepID=UPI003209995A